MMRLNNNYTIEQSKANELLEICGRNSLLEYVSASNLPYILGEQIISDSGEEHQDWIDSASALEIADVFIGMVLSLRDLTQTGGTDDTGKR